MPHTVFLSQKGSLWTSHRPLTDYTGVLLTACNTSETSGAPVLHNLSKRNRANGYSLYAFELVCFDSTGENFACVDRRGNLFVFKLKLNRYALVKRLGASASTIQFSKRRCSELLVGLKDLTIQCYNIETNTLVGTFKGGHKYSITSISTNNASTVSLSCSRECVIIWDQDSFKKVKTLASKTVALSQALFTNSGTYLVTCLKSDLFVWDSTTCQFLFKLSIPDSKWKQQDVDITTFYLSDDEKVLIAGGANPSLFVWNFENRKLVRIFSLPTQSIASKKIKLSPDAQIASVLTSQGRICFIEVDTSKLITEVKQVHNDIIDFDINSKWEYMVTTLSDGSLQIYELPVLLHRKHHQIHLAPKPATPVSKTEPVEVTASNPIREHFSQNVYMPPNRSISSDYVYGKGTPEEIERRSFPRAIPKDASWKSNSVSSSIDQLGIPLNTKDLHKLLLNYGEYPTKYRPLIWRILLHLPENRESFSILLDRPVHYSLNDLHKRYPIVDSSLFRKLEKILSCFCYTAPIFSAIEFLPEMTFPFLKLLSYDLISTYEIVLTLIVNWSKDWFEYHPNPPMTILNMVQNLLECEDPELAEHFTLSGFPVEVYAWHLLKTVFTEVLTADQWLKVFDHIFSMPCIFMYYFVVAYLIHFRTTLLTIHRRQDLELFLQTINTCDIGKIIKRSYDMHQREDIKHPDYGVFEPLAAGNYPVINKYPKFIVDFQIKERERIRLVEEELLRKRKQMLNQQERELKQEERLEEEMRKYKALVNAENESWKESQLKEQELYLQRMRLHEQTIEEKLKELKLLEKEKQYQTSETKSPPEQDKREQDCQTEFVLVTANEEVQTNKSIQDTEDASEKKEAICQTDIVPPLASVETEQLPKVLEDKEILSPSPDPVPIENLTFSTPESTGASSASNTSNVSSSPQSTIPTSSSTIRDTTPTSSTHTATTFRESSPHTFRPTADGMDDFSKQRELILRAEDKLHYLETLLEQKRQKLRYEDVRSNTSFSSNQIASSKVSGSSILSTISTQTSLPTPLPTPKSTPTPTVTTITSDSLKTETRSTSIITNSPSSYENRSVSIPSFASTSSRSTSSISSFDSDDEISISQTLKDVSTMTNMLQKKRQEMLIQRRFQEFMTRKEQEKIQQEVDMKQGPLSLSRTDLSSRSSIITITSSEPESGSESDNPLFDTSDSLEEVSATSPLQDTTIDQSSKFPTFETSSISTEIYSTSTLPSKRYVLGIGEVESVNDRSTLFSFTSESSNDAESVLKSLNSDIILALSNNNDSSMSEWSSSDSELE